MIPGTKGSSDPSSLFPQNDSIASSVFAGNYPIDASSSLLEDDLDLHLCSSVAYLVNSASSYLRMTQLPLVCFLVIYALTPAPLHLITRCCASYAGSQSVDASFPPFLDD